MKTSPQTLPKTKNKPIKIREILKRMGQENFGKYIQGNGEVFILRSLEFLREWKEIKIGQNQKQNRMRGKVLQTGKVFNPDNSPFWVILNVMYKKDLRYVADLVYKEEKIFTEGKFRTSANISWNFQDNSEVAISWAKKELRKEKEAVQLSLKLWDDWTEKLAEEKRTTEQEIIDRPKKQARAAEKRAKNKIAKRERLDKQLLEIFS